MIASVGYLALLFALILLGVPIAFAIGFVALVALGVDLGLSVLPSMATQAWQTTNSFALSAAPLFLLLGEIVYRSGLTDRLFTGLGTVMDRVPGRLVQSNIAAATVFAASSGASVASAAALSPMVYEAEVRDRHYDARLVLGSLTAAGTLGVLIPPSVLLILYGVATGNSISALFVAGIVPGLITALLFALYIATRALLNPSMTPSVEEERGSLLQRLQGLLHIWPFILIAIVVLGSIYTGVATPTESAAVGVLLAIVLSTAFGTVNVRVMRTVLIAAARTTSMLYLVLVASSLLGQVFARSGLIAGLQQLLADRSPLVVLLLILAMFVVLGCVFDALSMMLLTLPIVMPLILAAGYDPIWFGVILALVVEAGLVTPPVGLNLFVVRGATGADLSDVLRGSMPFVLVQGAAIGIFVAFPQLVLWLPQQMR